MNENTESRFNTMACKILFIDIMIGQLCSLMEETPRVDILTLKNERGALLRVSELNRELGTPTRYTMEDYATFNNILDIDEFIDHIDSFNLSDVIDRITTLIGSATFDKFLKESRSLKREKKEIDFASIIFTYLSGNLAFHHIPVTTGGIDWVTTVIRESLNGTETLDSYIDNYADKEYMYGKDCEYEPTNDKNDGMYYGVFVDPNSKVSIDGNVLDEFEDYREFRNYVLDKASIYYGRMKAYKSIETFIKNIIQNNCPMTSNEYSAKICFFRLVLENLIEHSPMQKAMHSLLKSAAMATNIDEIICLATDSTLEILEKYEDGHASLELYKIITHIDTTLTDAAFDILNHIDIESFDSKIDWIYRIGDIEDMIRDTYCMAARIRDFVQRNSRIGDSTDVDASFDSLSKAVHSDPDLKAFLDNMKVGVRDLIEGILHFGMFNLFFDTTDRRIPPNNFKFAAALQDTYHFLQAMMCKLNIGMTTEMTRRHCDRRK